MLLLCYKDEFQVYKLYRTQLILVLNKLLFKFVAKEPFLMQVVIR